MTRYEKINSIVNHDLYQFIKIFKISKLNNKHKAGQNLNSFIELDYSMLYSFVTKLDLANFTFINLN